MRLYFAYGANLNHAGMSWRCPQAVAIEPFYLMDYRLAFSGVATIQPAPGQRVPGALWAITEECEKALDQFEGYPTMYRKEIITVDGMEIMFYRMNSEEPWEPADSYLAIIAEGYCDFGLPLEDLERAVLINQLEVEQRCPETRSLDWDRWADVSSEPDLSWARQEKQDDRLPW
jgi:gamma-glutamylcyclotransferase